MSVTFLDFVQKQKLIQTIQILLFYSMQQWKETFKYCDQTRGLIAVKVNE